MPFYDNGGPLVFAHRGGSALAPENTIAAFDAGIAAGADGLELDVHLSADGVVVVHHDATLDRTTNASGPVAARTVAELARVDPGDGRGIPTLRQVLARYHTRIIVEMKCDAPELGEAVAREVATAHAIDRVCVAGFGRRAVDAARRALPGVASSASSREVRLALYRSWIGWPAWSLPYGGFQVPESAEGHRVVSPRFVRHAHRHRLQVQVWTVNEEADMRRLLGWGVDALISDRPDRAVRVRDACARGVASGEGFGHD